MSSIPILSSLTEVLSGTIEEGFKGKFKPASLVASAIFLALNFIVVLPALRDYGVGVVIAVEALPSIWEVALGSLTLVLLGYVINSLGGFFLSLANGNWFRESCLGNLLKTLQQKKYDSMVNELSTYSKKPEDPKAKTRASRAAHRLALEYPDRDVVAPNRLGNVLGSASSYTWNQYGVHLGTLWPAMDRALLKEDEKLHGRLAENLDALTFLVSLNVLLVVVAVELAVIRLVLGPPLQALWAFAFLLLAYIVYLAAVHKAQTWGRDVRLAFDLYLDKVETKLGLQPLNAYGKEEDRKKRWEEVSQWLLYGGLKPSLFEDANLEQPMQDASWYHPKATTVPYEPKLTFPHTVNVEPHHQELDAWDKMIVETPSRKADEWCLPGREVEYLFAITNADSGQHAKPVQGSFLLVEDKRLPILPDLVEGSVNGWQAIKGKRQQAKGGHPEALLWCFDDISVWATILLKYTIRYDLRVKVTSANAEIEDILLKTRETVTEVEIKLKYTKKNAQDVTVLVTVINRDQLPQKANYSIEGGTGDLLTITPNSGGTQGSFTIPNVDNMSDVTLVF